MTEIDRNTALALIAGRLGDYPVIRRLPDGLKAELEPLERGRNYGGIICRLADDIQPVSADYNMDFLVPVLHAIRAASKAQDARLRDALLELENACLRNRELRAALEKSASEVTAWLRRRAERFGEEGGSDMMRYSEAMEDAARDWAEEIAALRGEG